MTQIVVDAQTKDEVLRETNVVEVVDAQGNMLGFFRPMRRPPSDSVSIPPLTEAELDRRAAQPGKYTTEEVLQHLRSL